MDPLQTQHIDRLAACLDSFIAAWDTGGAPVLAEYVPDVDDSLRAHALPELVKIDLEYRWTQGEGQTLDAYLAEFPELDSPEGPAPELIYEEFVHRRNAGDTVSSEAYLQRYPGRAERLQTLFDLDAPDATSAVPRNIPEPGAVLDDFLLIERLGTGAFATVFLALQQSMHRTVALKVSANRGEEAQTLAQLDHPNIVRVFDQRSLPDQDLRLLYMEYVPAGSLETVVARVRETPPADRCGRLLLDVVGDALAQRGEELPTDSKLQERLEQATWSQAVCIQGSLLADALGHAHDQGVLHRDVKPANVLLSRTGAAKLADFNVSYSEHDEACSPEAYLGGSLAYMAPEQLEACSMGHDRSAATLDGRADVFSLGVVLYELLTGERPFADAAVGDDLEAAIDAMIARRRAGVQGDRLALVPPDAPRMLFPTIERALRAEPSQRFASATDMARQLDLCTLPRASKLLDPAPTGAARWVRRHGLLALLLTAVVPSALLSLLNTLYNVMAVIEDPQYAGFMDMVMTVNTVAFGAGIAILVAWIRSPARAVRDTLQGAVAHAPERARLRRQLLRLPEKMMLVVFPLWVLGGIAFPIWLGGASRSWAWLNFTGSNLLFGVLAATATYFASMRLVLEVMLPSVASPGEGTAEDSAGLRRAHRHATIWFAVLATVPFLAVISLALLDLRERAALLVLGIVGSVSFALAYRAMLAIRRDANALQQALDLRATRR